VVLHRNIEIYSTQKVINKEVGFKIFILGDFRPILASCTDKENFKKRIILETEIKTTQILCDVTNLNKDFQVSMHGFMNISGCVV
jgi:hypothetical protein